MGAQWSCQDAENIYTVIEECSELWDDPTAWQLHAARAVETVVGGFVGLIILGSQDESQENIEYATAYKSNVSFREFLRSGGEKLVPGADRGFAAMHLHGQHCGTFSELTGKEYWQSEFFEAYMKPQHAHETLCALARTVDRMHVNLSVSREAGERKFSERDRMALGTLAAALARRVGVRLTTREHLGKHLLSPRERATLSALLDGHSEKEVAFRLGLSPATVHEYVTSVYRHFGVRSRGELMAYFLRRVPIER